MSEKATKIFIGCVIIAIAGVMAWGVYYYVLSPVVIGQPGSTTTAPVTEGIFPSTDFPGGGGGNGGSSGGSYGGGGTSGGNSGNANGGGDVTTTDSGNNIVADKGINSAWMLINKPIAGFTLIEKQIGQASTTAPYTRFIEKGTGHIYDIAPNERTAKKITNTTTTKVNDSFWNRDGKSVVMRRQNDDNGMDVLFASVKEVGKGTTTEDLINNAVGKLETSKMPDGVTEVAVSPSGTKLFNFKKLDDGSYSGVLSDFPDDKIEGKKQETIISLPIGEWQISWPNESLLTFTTKPSVEEPGYLFFLTTKDKRFYKVIGGINGLTTNTSPSGKKVLIAEIVDRQPKLSIYDVTKDAIAPLTIKTLPEKCVWGSDDNTIYCGVPSVIENDDYPDVWYQGIRSFNDEIWKLNATTLKTELIARKETFQAGSGVDATNLRLSLKENYLVFINKKDSKPWIVKIK